jgi:hypothetical protein
MEICARQVLIFRPSQVLRAALQGDGAGTPQDVSPE